MDNGNLFSADMASLSNRSADSLSYILAQMVSVLKKPEASFSFVHDKNWFARMCRTLFGGQEVNLDIFIKNRNKINVYILNAIKSLVNHDNIEPKTASLIKISLGKLYSDKFPQYRLLCDVLSKLYDISAIECGFERLADKIENNDFAATRPIVSLYGVLSQVDLKSVSNPVHALPMELLEEKGIINKESKTVFDFLKELCSIPRSSMGRIYLLFSIFDHCPSVKLLMEVIERYFFVAAFEFTILNRDMVIKDVLSKKFFSHDAEISLYHFFSDVIGHIDSDVSVNLYDTLNDIKLRKAENLFIAEKYDEALEVFSFLAERGISKAMYYIAAYYHYGFGSTEKNESLAIEYAEKGAENGAPVSLLFKALSRTVSADEKNEILKGIFSDLQRCAEKGEAFAQYHMSHFYKYGYAVEKDDSKRLFWLKKAIENGFFPAVTETSEALSKGWEAIPPSAYIPSAKRGILDAQIRLAKAYQYGYGTEKDDEEYVRWKNRSCQEHGEFKFIERAAELGFGDAQFMLAECLEKGENVEKDESAAFSWYKKAAEQNIPEALFRMSEYYSSGSEFTEKYRSEEEAFALCERAAELGYIKAQFHLAERHFYGRGTPEDKEKSIVWYKRAADKKDPNALFCIANFHTTGELCEKSPDEITNIFLNLPVSDFPEIAVHLSERYSKGIGTVMDEEKARKWREIANENGYSGIEYYKTAAGLGYMDAQLLLAKAYLTGEYGKKDEKAAVELFIKVAEQGEHDAQYQLAELYRKGTGVAVNKEAAANWYLKAAEVGNNDAQYRVAEAYRMGDGVPKDDEAAVVWLRRAADNGHENAIRRLKQLGITI